KELFTLGDARVDGKHPGLATDGKRLFTSGAKSIKVWDMETGKELPSPFKAPGDARFLAVSMDGKRLVMGTAREFAKVFDVETGTETHVLRGRGDKLVQCMAVSPDGTRVFAGTFDHSICMWDVANDKDFQTLHGHDDPLECLAVSRDGTQLAS